MHRPRVRLDNYDKVYDFYRQYAPGDNTARMLHGVIKRLFRPQVMFVGDAQPAIERLLSDGRTLVLAANHLNVLDPFNLVAAVCHDPVLRPIAQNVFIPAKSGVQAVPVIRHLVDSLGAVPVFREKKNRTLDIRKAPQLLGRKAPDDSGLYTCEAPARISFSDEPFQSRAFTVWERIVSREPDKTNPLTQATHRFIDLAVHHLDSGRHMTLFPETTCQNENPARLQMLHRGIGLIVSRTTKIEPPAIVPAGLWYGERRNVWGSVLLSPTLIIGNPIEGPFRSSRRVINELVEPMQSCLDRAIEVHHAA
jgi:1-acyl-sn-glycerol-3-phosphate acyltransferase